MVAYIHSHVLVWLQPFLLFHFTQRPDMSYDIELNELTHQKPFKNYSVTPDDYISWQLKKIIDMGAEELTPWL